MHTQKKKNIGNSARVLSMEIIWSIAERCELCYPNNNLIANLKNSSFIDV